MSIWSRVANVFRGEKLSSEIAEEMESHIAEAIEQGRYPDEMNGIAGYYFYTSNWQKQARELDPNGPVGQMAAIGLMARVLP